MKLLVYVVQKYYDGGRLGDTEIPLVDIELPEKTGISLMEDIKAVVVKTVREWGAIERKR